MLPASPDPHAGKKPWLAAGVLLLLTIGFACFKSSRRDPSGGGAIFDAHRPPVRPAEPADTGLPGGRAPGGSSTPAHDVTDFEDFLDMLAKSGEQPAAKEFAKEFVQEPALHKVFEDFKEDQRSPKPRGDLEAFARELGSRAEFRRLLAKFSQDPGFKQLVPSFMRFPQFRGAIHEQLLALRSAKGGRARASLIAAASRRGGAPSRVLGAASGSRPGTRASAVGASSGGGFFAGAAGDGSGAPDDGGGPGSAVAPSGEAGAHDVGSPLEGLATIDSDKDAAKAFVSLCYRKGSQITREQCAALEEYLGDYGLWEACAKANLYEKCSGLCDQNKELKCGTVPNFYDICVSAGESNCVARCNQIAGCIPPPPPSPPPSVGIAGGGGPTGGGTGAAGSSCRPGTATENGGYCSGGRWIMQQRTCTTQCAGGSPRRTCGSWRITSCFPAGTPVATPDGERPIETLRAGDRAYAVDPVTGALIETVVAGSHRRAGQALLSAVLADGRAIRATKEHPFWDPDAREYRPLGRWVAGQRMLARAGPGAPFAPVRLLRLEPVAGEYEVFNVSIAHPNHNFVAGGVLVHNKFICY